MEQAFLTQVAEALADRIRLGGRQAIIAGNICVRIDPQEYRSPVALGLGLLEYVHIETHDEYSPDLTEKRTVIRWALYIAKGLTTVSISDIATVVLGERQTALISQAECRCLPPLDDPSFIDKVEEGLASLGIHLGQ